MFYEKQVYVDKYYKHFIVSKIRIEAREMAKPLRAFVVFAKGQESSSPRGGSQAPAIAVPGDLVASSDLHAHQGQMWCA